MVNQLFLNLALGALVAYAGPGGAQFEYEYHVYWGLWGLLSAWLQVLRGPQKAPFGVPRKALYLLPLFMLTQALGFYVVLGGACSLSAHLGWTLLESMPFYYLGLVLYSLRAYSDARGFSLNRFRLGLSLGLLALIAAELLLLWIHPQKRLSGILVGFIHGPIYDRLILGDYGLGLSRLSHLGLLMAIIVLLNSRDFWRSRLALLLCLAGLGFKVASLGFPSQGIGLKALRDFLPLVAEQKAFRLYLPKEGLPKTQAKLLEAEIAFHLDELSGVFGAPPRPLEIFIYPDEASKKLYFGGGQTDITDVYTPSIHISAGGGRLPTLRHELVHALGSFRAFYGLGFHPYMALTEGLAVALAPERREKTLLSYAADLQQQGRLPPQNLLFGPGFFMASGERSYTAAGAFILYLARIYGLGPVIKFYNAEGSFAKLFGKDLAELYQSFSVDLAKALRPQARLSSEARSRSRGLLYDQCPHTRAADRYQGPCAAENRWQKSLWEPYLSSAKAKADVGEGSYPSVMHWRKRAKLACTEGQSQPLTHLSELSQAIRLPPRSIEDVELSLIKSDLEACSGARTQSLETLKELESHNPESFGVDLLRALAARLEIEALDLEQHSWRLYLGGFEPTPPKAQSATEPWLVEYLRLRRDPGKLRGVSELRAALDLPLGPKLHPSFYAEWYRLIYEKAFELEAYTEAKKAVQGLILYAPEGAKAYWQLESRFLTALLKKA